MSLDSQLFKELPHVEGELNYLAPTAEKPVNYTYDPPPGIPQRSGKYEVRTLPIYNARTISQEVSLDQQGFALTEHHSTVKDFYDQDEVRRVYYPEAEQFLKDLTGAQRVIVFDHNLRNAERAKQGEQGIKTPVRGVHNDFTAKSGYSRARTVLETIGTEDPDELLQHRFSVVNLWRPIAGPVQESPLAVCDAQSIAPTDLVTTDLVYRDRIGETYAVTYNPKHQWFYFPQMQRTEALLIKCFDSAKSGLARFAAHTAFDDPTSQPDAPPRESIELRTLVFYPA
ncbi:CmcJ/NvfI family oxidoreductase [Nostoc sp.]|uniref:CmcJ/NvfI family oxidoreductase n=1 Tax=Nostoc sp. TaxID=1180 RepID=UPI002FF59FA1